MAILDLSRWRRMARRLPVLFIFLLMALITACAGSQEGSPETSSVASTMASTLPPPSITRVSDLSSTPTGVPQPESTSLPPSSTPTQIPTQAAPLRFPDPAGYEWRPVISDLSNPVGMANAGDGSGRLFILEQAGRIRIVKDGTLLAEPFLDIVSQVDCCGERGLLGLAFDPDYETNGFFYINYIDLNGNTVIARWQVSGNPDLADAGSESMLMEIAQPFPNHNGGGMAFGPDGYLYLGLGDGGSGGDPLGNGQNPNSVLGKILRLDVTSAEPYAVPSDNPFVQGDGAPEVWAWGLRNPWRFSFDRLNGDLWIGDVGQGSWEEINYLPAGSPAGANFGWNYREGMHPFARSEAAPPADLVLIDPVAEYGHDQGISVTGGYVYRGAQLPELSGIYLYGDYGSGLVWGLLRDAEGDWQNALLFQTGLTITSFGEDEQGEVYLVNYRGELYRLERK